MVANALLIKCVYVLLFTFIGLILIYSKFMKWKKKVSKCSLRVVAIVNDVYYGPAPGFNKGKLHKPFFSVYINGEKITIDSAKYSNMVEFEKGEQIELLLNPNNYNEFIYFDKSLNKGIKADILSCSIYFLFVLFIILFF